MIALDTTALSALFIPGAKLCRAGTNTPIKHGKERLEMLVERIAKERDTILIPTPVLSELLVCIQPDKITDLLTQLNASVWFRVEAFDTAAAVELGVRTAKAIRQETRGRAHQPTRHGPRSNSTDRLPAPVTPVVRGSGDVHPEDQAGAETAEEKAEGKEAGSD